MKLDDVPQGKVRLEIVKVEGAKDFEKDITVDLPKPIAPRLRGDTLSLSMKTHPVKVDFPVMLVLNKTGFDVSLKVPAVAMCKNPPKDVAQARKDLLKKREDAHGKIDPAKTPKEKMYWNTLCDGYDKLLTFLDFFEAANQIKVHFRVYLDAGEEQKIVLATTEGS